MTTIVDQHQQQVFKHYCKICKKGFGCGRALGGHMRAHGIGEDHGNIEEDEKEEDEDLESYWEKRIEGKHKRSYYASRTNTNRHKNCRTCENCGKEFSSWKSFLEHGKCSSAEAESLVSSKGSDDEDIEAEDGITPGGYGWSKGKRTRRSVVNNKLMGNTPSIPSHCPSREEEDLANCLVMLSNAVHDNFVDPLAIVAETEESCASAIREDEERRKPVALLGGATRPTTLNTNYNRVPNFDQKAGKNVAFTNIKGGMFECKACKKVFSSHQALGGHRASHKKVKGCFASKFDNVLDESVVMEEDVITNDEFNVPTKSSTPQPLVSSLDQHYNHQPFSCKKKSKVHECSICHRIFSSGQALGGHKRCHWLNSSSSTETSSIINKLHPQKFQGLATQIYNHHHLQTQPSRFISSHEPALDLNLPAPTDDYNNFGTRGETRPRLSFEMAPTEIYLQPWIQNNDEDSNKYNSNNSATTLVNINGEDKEEDANEDFSKLKLAKLSELKDMHIGGAGGAFSWLQVGIGSPTSNVGSNP